MIADLQYRAFLSYSHRDTACAKWLHRALEGYRIDKDLVGRETAYGPVPKTLRPIFRDREDFSAGHSLNEQTVAALEASQFLVVICSPNAARSTYVNEEIRLFKALGGGARVIPLIVDGEPGDPERECFPPAVRFKLGADGVLTDERERPIAADARPQGDGKEIAKHKIVAGLLGVGLDEIMRRAERARRRRNLFRIAAAGAAALVIACGVVGWTGALSIGSRLDSAELLSMKSDVADHCVEANKQAVYYKVAETRRIALAVKCVGVLSEGLDELPQNVYVPLKFLDSYEANIAILQSFQDGRMLTPQQADVLNKAQRLLAGLRKS
jgi:TIR domain-containing protein